MKCPNCNHEFSKPWSPLFGEQLRRIIEAVCEVYETTHADLLAKGRLKCLAEARCVAMFLAREHTGMSYPELGRAFGNRDHSTIISAVRRIAWERHCNALLAERLAAVAELAGVAVERTAAE